MEIGRLHQWGPLSWRFNVTQCPGCGRRILHYEVQLVARRFALTVVLSREV